MRKKFFLLIIVCLVMGAGVMAQTSTVSGTVFAEDNNEPIIGASVLVLSLIHISEPTRPY